MEIKLIYNDLIGPEETRFESLTTSQRTVIFSIFYCFGINPDNDEFHEDDSINEFYKAVIAQDWDDASQSLKSYRRPRYQKVRRTEERHLLETNTDSGECPSNVTTPTPTPISTPTATPTPTPTPILTPTQTPTPTTTHAPTTTAVGSTICACDVLLVVNDSNHDSLVEVVFSGCFLTPEHLWKGDDSGPYPRLLWTSDDKGIIDIFFLYPRDVFRVSYKIRYHTNTTLTMRKDNGNVLFVETVIDTTGIGFAEITFNTTNICDVQRLTIDWNSEINIVNIRNLAIDICVTVTICTCDVPLVLNDSNHDSFVEVVFSGPSRHPGHLWLGASPPFSELIHTSDAKAIIDIFFLYPRDVLRVSYQMRYHTNTTLTMKNENEKVLFLETMIFTTEIGYVDVIFFSSICGVEHLTIDWGSEDFGVNIRNLEIDICIIEVPTTTPTITTTPEPTTTAVESVTMCPCDVPLVLNDSNHDSIVEVVFSGEFQYPEQLWLGSPPPYPQLYYTSGGKGIIDIFFLYPRDVFRVSYQMRDLTNTTITMRDENGKVLFVETMIVTTEIGNVDINFFATNVCGVQHLTIDWNSEIMAVRIRNLAIEICINASCDTNFFKCASCTCLVSGNECLVNDTQICNGMPNCILKDGSCACGVFQITESYFNECNTTGNSLPINDWYGCALDSSVCATMCVYNYVHKYGPSCTGKNQEEINCLEYARIHFGGPNGCNNEFPVKEILDDCCA